ncbi:hypothetical protein LIA77_00292 [Sarocladium implicatum]|nr:hypothetical protein LIA77_00292 [Sarocladium implicatum]
MNCRFEQPSWPPWRRQLRNKPSAAHASPQYSQYEGFGRPYDAAWPVFDERLDAPLHPPRIPHQQIVLSNIPRRIRGLRRQLYFRDFVGAQGVYVLADPRRVPRQSCCTCIPE